MLPITIDDIRAADQRIRDQVHRTPLMTSTQFDAHCGNSVFHKCENLQRAGSFKIRGAYNTISSLTDEQKAAGIVAHSSGNHAQAAALAARIHGVKAVIVMPQNAPEAKVDATRGYGAEIEFTGNDSDDRRRRCSELAAEHGYTIVPPYDDLRIMAGAGTVALEILDQQPDIDYLFVPIGGGGLIAGCAVAAKALRPEIKVIGVETEAANDAYLSKQRGEIVRIDPPDTICDGIRVQAVGKGNWEVIRDLVDEVVLVSDAEVLETMRFILQRMKILVEPTGAVAPSAAYQNKLGLTERRIACVISGGNVDADVLRSVL